MSMRELNLARRFEASLLNPPSRNRQILVSPLQSARTVSPSTTLVT